MQRVSKYNGGDFIKIDRELLKGCISLMVLRLFSETDLYGYQIIKNLEQLSQKAFIFKDGTLYPILHGLEKSAYIKSYWQESETGRKRKYYSITEKGKEYLSNKLDEWGYFTQSVNMVLNGGVDVGED
jgi:PadR family transcriptional regulator PadR